MYFISINYTIMDEVKENSFRLLLAFIKTRSFLKHFGLSIIIAFGLVFAVVQSLGPITHHGENLSVPDFTGLSLKKAYRLSREKNLKLEIIDSVDNAPGKRGTVIAQSPPPNFKVKEGRTIHITLKTFNPRSINMPDFTGVSLVQAKADIETYGLKIGKLKYVPDMATNNVLEQRYEGKTIKPGTRILRGSTIDLVLGLGKSDQIVVVPNLVGYTRADAIQKATDNSLNIGAFIFDETVITSDDSTSAIIWKQSPVVNVQSTMGSPIDVWLTLDSDKIKSINHGSGQ
jgi:eukaryotic-like serine/threonine-protein kinase